MLCRNKDDAECRNCILLKTSSKFAHVNDARHASMIRKSFVFPRILCLERLIVTGFVCSQHANAGAIGS